MREANLIVGEMSLRKTLFKFDNVLKKRGGGMHEAACSVE